jgi:hypothetical protein
MDTIKAFVMGESARSAGKRERVFDWDGAARKIREAGAKSARAGLQGDWEWTGGSILEDGKPVPADETYTYLCSVWAAPELEINGEVVECWVYRDESPGWDSKTYWPPSALSILGATPGTQG